MLNVYATWNIEIKIFGLNFSIIDFTFRIACIMLCNLRQKELDNTSLFIIFSERYANTLYIVDSLPKGKRQFYFSIFWLYQHTSNLKERTNLYLSSISALVVLQLEPFCLFPQRTGKEYLTTFPCLNYKLWTNANFIYI